jgi:hypothetical protein
MEGWRDGRDRRDGREGRRERGRKCEKQTWWHMPLAPVLWRVRQEDPKFKACLTYIVRPCLKKTKLGKKGKGSGAIDELQTESPRRQSPTLSAHNRHKPETL